MKHYVSNAIMCPFYKQEQATKIHCDGVCRHNTVQLSFDDEDYKKYFRKIYCMNIKGYYLCPIYLAIYQQYKEEGDE